MPLRTRAIAAAVTFAVLVLAADAASARPPGGLLPLAHGGDNQAPFPALSTVAVEESAPRPLEGISVSCHPNPSPGSVRFRAVARAGDPVRVRLFGVSGRLVREWQLTGVDRGSIEWTWDGRDARGRRVGAGLYFYRAESGGHSTRGKIVLLGTSR